MLVEVCTNDPRHQGAGSPVHKMQPSYGPTNVSQHDGSIGEYVRSEGVLSNSAGAFTFCCSTKVLHEVLLSRCSLLCVVAFKHVNLEVCKDLIISPWSLKLI